MLYQKLRTFVFMVMALTGPSAAVLFECNDAADEVACLVTLTSNNQVRYGPTPEVACTGDNQY